jgi:hypothetical protein
MGNDTLALNVEILRQARPATAQHPVNVAWWRRQAGIDGSTQDVREVGAYFRGYAF